MINYCKLKTLRTTKKISLQEMADALGLLTAGGYSRVESGENKLKAEHLPILAEKFGISMNRLTKEIFFDNKVEECSIYIDDSPKVVEEKEVI
ncbi:helix-turn-helix domain-containing protein [Paenibacillus glucanolyticus]|jgi:transcriptional regulator with XRE-family HTH domain|uniref:helix-turn-helix domain-containing protein n=1 Tax=Paenibacillus glucanolyticus TaxID=59843 RepID=UPI00128B16D4|nr:helix-turn-helix transcriptional regulator [Paenibacillus glucanolyticus]MPY20255.1 helix-turn-helix transcriptional regulator [Paenibacillus glucanolyticus]